MSNFVRIAAVLIVCSVATGVSAQEVATAAGSREHDGFFLQMQYGPAYQRLGDGDGSISGGGGSLLIAVGGSPVTNLVLFGEMSVQVALNPQVDFQGESGTADAALSFSTFGPGVAYYFGASNFFLSGMVGPARASIETPFGVATATGFGWRIGAGKEWWVSDQWGLGLAANLHMANVTDAADFDYPTNAVALAFSATYQ